MRAFGCGTCGQLVFFENSECLRCGSALAFDADALDVVVLDSSTDGPEDEPSGEGDTGPIPRRCANARLAECNWLARTDASGSNEGLCLACSLTRTRPADDDPDGLAAFAATEAAKRRLVFQLLDLGLPVVPVDDAEDTGLAFDLLSSRHQSVLIGHDDGLITLDLAETDDARREELRHQLGEPYRTMLGHLRHEIGHYYWPLLVGPDDRLVARSRELVGDESVDYQAALDRHYGEGPPADWPERYVDAYATMHPAEDWAETFAHYLHIRDTLETAAAFGVEVTGPADGTEDIDDSDELVSSPDLEVTGQGFDDLLADWLPLTYALNAINRSMGAADLYPFVLAPAVVEKLTFVHEVVEQSGRSSCS